MRANITLFGLFRGKKKNILSISVFVETILSKVGVFFIGIVFFPNKLRYCRKILFYRVASGSDLVRLGAL